MSTQNAQLLTEIQAAERMALSVQTLRAWRTRGVGPVWLKIGRNVRYSVADLDQYLEDARCASTAVHGRYGSERVAV